MGAAGGEPAGGADKAARLAVGGVRHRTGVDDDDGGFAHGIDDVVAGGAETGGDILAIGKVELAAQGEHGGNGPAGHGGMVSPRADRGQGGGEPEGSGRD